MFDELFELMADGAFASREEFNAFVSEATNEEIFSLVKEGAFADLNEFNSIYKEGDLKKKDTVSVSEDGSSELRDTRRPDYQKVEEPSLLETVGEAALGFQFGGLFPALYKSEDDYKVYKEEQEAYERQQKDEEFTKTLVEADAALPLPERETLAPVSELMPRVGEMEQPDGEPSTHLMRREYIAEDKTWVAFPSLFQNEDGTWVDMSEQAEEAWEPVFEEAKRRGEVAYFGEDEMAATEFADEGSWKKRYEDDVKHKRRVSQWEEDSNKDANWKYTAENKEELLDDLEETMRLRSPANSAMAQASQKLRADKTFMLKAISQNPSAIAYASPSLLDDEIFIREAIKLRPESAETIKENATLRLQDKLRYVGTALEDSSDIGYVDMGSFERNISNITGDLIDAEEEDVVPKLNYQLNQYGFTFEETTWGDALTATASNGETKFIHLDNVLSSHDSREAKELQDWLRENKEDNPELRAAADKQRRILGEEEVMAAVKAFNEETEEFQKKINSLTASYSENAAIIESLAMEGKTSTPEYEAALKKNQEIISQSKRLQEDEEYFKIQGARLDLQVGRYTEMKAEQGTFSGALWNKFTHGTVGTSKAAVRMMTSIGTSPIFESEFHVRNNIVRPAQEILSEIGITIPENLLEKDEDGQYVREDELLEFIKKTKVSNIPKELLPFGDNLVDALDEKYEDKITKRTLYGSPTYRNPYSGKAASIDLDKSGMIDAIDEGARMYYTAGNTTEQFEAMKSEGFWGGALLGLAESLPAMIGGNNPIGFAQRTAQMYALSTEHVYDEMEKDPDFDNISEDEKFYVTAPIGITVGILEAVGLRNIARSNPVVLNLAHRALGKSTSKTTAKTFGEYVRRDIKSKGRRWLTIVAAGGAAEFETGLTQEIAEIGVKDIYNWSKEKDMFQTPDTWQEYVAQTLRAGAQEMIGGFIMGTLPATANALQNGTLAEMDDTVWAVFKEMSADENYKTMSMTALKNKILSGKITVKQAKEIEAAYNELLGIMPSITTDLSPMRQRQAVQLLLKKQKLDSEIERKSPLLVKGRKKKVEEIKKQITELEADQLRENQEQQRSEENIEEFGVSSKTQEKTDDDVTDEERTDIEGLFREETEESTETVEENLSINKKGGISYTPKQREIRNKVVRAARRGARAISKLLPNTRIVLHESNDEYLKYTNGKEGRGEYIDDVVHINLSQASLSTVGHEIFHAVFLDKLKTDERTARVAAKMIVSVGKSLSKSSPLRKHIEAFAAKYTGELEIVQNEEMLAELVGILSQVKGEYKSLSKPSKSKVIEFLKKLAKSLGMEKLLGPEFGKTDESVIDLLNTLSKKIREGEVIEESEVEVLESGELIKEADGPIPNNIEEDGPSINLNATRQQQVNRGGIDLSSIKRGSINDLSGANAFVFAADQATYGKVLSPSGLEFDFFGGYLYPYGSGFGWAFTEEVAAKKALSKVKESDGVGLVMSQAPDGITGSFRLFEYLNAEITHAINKGANPKELLDYVNQKLRLTKVAQGLKNKGLPSQISSIEELALLMPYEGEQKISYEVRGEFAKTFFSAESTNKFGIPPLNPTAKHDVGVLDYVNDPSLKNVEYGDIVSAIQFDKNSPIREVREGEPNFHPSYPFVINGTPIMIFNNAVDVRKVYPNAKPKSPKANQTPIGKRKKSAAARSAMGGQYVAQVPSEIDVKDSKINVSRQQKLAPNGKPSKLSPEQYKLVRTPAFKKWFGDWESNPENSSKVVDENGEPLVVYHGTQKDGINVFDIRIAEEKREKREMERMSSAGFFFTDSFETAKAYSVNDGKFGDIIEVFLDVKNPSYDAQNLQTLNQAYLDFYTEEGFDGGVMPETINGKEYIAFESNQIKLADGSNKTFDPSKPSIRQQKISPYSLPENDSFTVKYHKTIYKWQKSGGKKDIGSRPVERTFNGKWHFTNWWKKATDSGKNTDLSNFEVDGKIIDVNQLVKKPATRQQIIGENAELAPQVRKDLMYAKAEHNMYMEQKEGLLDVPAENMMSPAAIKEITGWELGVDGKWRYEIEDGRLKEVKNGTHKLGDIYDAPEFYEAYPDAKDIAVTITVREGGRENSWFMPEDNSIEINVKDQYRVIQDLVHELQHFVQFKEGFAIGGNADTFYQNPEIVEKLEKEAGKQELVIKNEMLRALSFTIEEAIDEHEDVPLDRIMTKEFLEENMDFYIDPFDALVERELIDENADFAQALEDFYFELPEIDRRKLKIAQREGGMDEALDVSSEIAIPVKEALQKWGNHAMYERLMGEVEARNVTTRLYLTKEGRARKTLESTEDVSREDQIAYFGDAKDTPAASTSPRQQTVQSLAQIYGMNRKGYFPRTTTMFQVQKAFKKYGLGVKKSRDDGYGRGGGLYLTRNGSMYNPFKNEPLRPRQQKPMDEYITEAREAHFRDNVIRDFLVRGQNFKKKVVDAALEVSRDMFEKLPDSFKNMEGGIKEGEKLYKKIENHRRKLERNNAKRTAWKSDSEIKLMVSDLRATLRDTYDTDTQIKEKVKKKREELRKKKLTRAEVKKKADKYRETLKKKRDEKKAEVDKKIETFEAKEKSKNKNRQQPLSEQEIMDKLIEFMQEQEAYIKEGDAYTEKGKTKYREGQSTQQARMMSELQSNVGIRPTQDMAAKVRRARRAVRDRMKGKRDLQAIKRALRNFMRVSLPADIYTKSEVMKLIRQITIADVDSLDNLMREVEEFVITKNVQRLQKQIEDILEGKYTETVNGRKKGVKIDLATMEQIEFINELLYNPAAKINTEVKNFKKKLEKQNLSKEEVKEKVAEFRKKLKGEETTAKNIADVNAKLQARWNDLSENPNATTEEQMEMVNLQMAIELNNAVLMENNDIHKVATLDMVSTTLSEMIEFGRSSLQAELAEQKAEYDRQFEIAYKEITGIDIDMSKREEAKEQLNKDTIKRNNIESQRKMDGMVKAFGRSILELLDGTLTRAEALDGLMDKISMMAGALFGGPLQDDVVTARVDESSRKFKGRRMFVELQVRTKLEELYGKNWQKKIRKNRVKSVKIEFDEEAIRAREEAYKLDPTPQNKKLLDDIKKEELRAYTQDELYYLYNQYKDPANEGAFEATFGANYESIMEQITENMTDEVKAFADWQVEELFPSLYEHYNDTYKSIYRTNMPWNEHYAGRIFRVGVTPEALDLLSGTANFNNSVNGASTRARTENSLPIQEMNGTDALMSYINDMEYFAAYAETVRDLNKLFTNRYIKNAIEVKFGKKTFDLINVMIKKIANKGVGEESHSSTVNTMNNAFILSRLGLNPVVMIKQLTSTFTYANDIGFRNWAKYSAKSIPELKKVWTEIRENSVYMQDRKYNGIMKALESYSETTMQEFVPKPTQDFMVNVLMSLVKYGDRSAIYLGGTANYMFYKDQALKQGKTEQEAIDIAIRKFERDTKRTQQSSDLHDRDYWQTHTPLARALNMFMTTPKQYLRKEIQAVRSLNRKLLAWDKNAGKGTIGQNVRTLLMYHVFMPVLFQYVAMGMPAVFRPWRDDDEDDLIRAAAIGNLNALFITGEIIAAIGDYFQGKPWAGESVKAAGSVTAARLIIGKFKRADKLKDPQKKADAMMKAYMELMTITAIPAPTLAKLAENYDKIISGETDDVGELILRLLNYSEYQISGPKSGQDKSTGKSVQEMYEDYNRQLRKEEQERKRQEKLLKSLYDEDRGGDRSRGSDRNSGNKRGSSRGGYKR